MVLRWQHSAARAQQCQQHPVPSRSMQTHSACASSPSPIEAGDSPAKPGLCFVGPTTAAGSTKRQRTQVGTPAGPLPLWPLPWATWASHTHTHRQHQSRLRERGRARLGSGVCHASHARVCSGRRCSRVQQLARKRASPQRPCTRGHMSHSALHPSTCMRARAPACRVFARELAAEGKRDFLLTTPHGFWSHYMVRPYADRGTTAAVPRRASAFLVDGFGSPSTCCGVRMHA